MISRRPIRLAREWAVFVYLCFILPSASTSNAQEPELVFADGFESGDASAWELVAPGPAPILAIVIPAALPIVRDNPTPAIRVHYFGGELNLDLSSLVVELDGVDLLPKLPC